MHRRKLIFKNRVAFQNGYNLIKWEKIPWTSESGPWFYSEEVNINCSWHWFKRKEKIESNRRRKLRIKDQNPAAWVRSSYSQTNGNKSLELI